MSAQTKLLVVAGSDVDALAWCEPLERAGFSPHFSGFESPPTEPRAHVALVVPGADTPPALIADRLRELVERGVHVLLRGDPGCASPVSPRLLRVPDTAPTNEIIIRLQTMAAYAAKFQQLEQELGHFERLAHQLRNHLGEVDHEMRLAGRLQRDLFPGSLLRLPEISFSAVFRPASWVSGDFYDVYRVDDHRVAMFIADAMGHGLAAGLMTMFLRHALRSRQSDPQAVESPIGMLTYLHELLLQQQLPHCQFATAAYALIDLRGPSVRIARAGHPHPLLLRAGGGVVPLAPEGGLLGIPDLPTDFEELTVELAVGDKLLFYTDGIEDTLLLPAENNSAQRLRPAILAHAALQNDAFIESLTRHLDTAEGSLHPEDDMTVLCGQIIQTSNTTRFTTSDSAAPSRPHTQSV